MYLREFCNWNISNSFFEHKKKKKMIFNFCRVQMKNKFALQLILSFSRFFLLQNNYSFSVHGCSIENMKQYRIVWNNARRNILINLASCASIIHLSYLQRGILRAIRQNMRKLQGKEKAIVKLTPACYYIRESDHCRF